MRVLVGGVGYRNLRDHSFGVLLVDALGAREWPAHVAVEDISYNPIAVLQRLEDDPPARRFGLAIVAGAVERGRRPGTLDVYRWDQTLPDDAAIQSAVAEAVTGVIALDNTLVVTRRLGTLPPTTVVLDAEPALHAFGRDVSPAVARALDTAGDIVTSLALDPGSAALLRELPLGAGRPARGRLATKVSDVRIRFR